LEKVKNNLLKEEEEYKKIKEEEIKKIIENK